MIVDIEQGTEEWLELRQSKITATDSAVILGLNPWKSKRRLWCQKIGLIEPDEANEAMRQGSVMEEPARLALINETGIHVKPAVVISDQHNFMMASMDGLSNDHQIGVEIKCGKKSFSDAKKGVIQPYYFCQMQHQMVVCNLYGLFYYCFDGKNGILMNVERDQNFINSMIPELFKFYKCMVNLEDPCPIKEEDELFI